MQIYKEFTLRYTIDQQPKILVFKKKGGASPKIIEFLLQLNSVKTQETSAQQR
jgi:hypothetical protein